MRSLPAMTRLVCDGRSVAPLEVAGSRAARRRGLLGRDGIDGAMWFPRTSWIHTMGMSFAIDVAWCLADGTVVRTRTVAPRQLTRPVLRARVVVEAAAGAFDRWDLAPGSRVEVASAAPRDGAAPAGEDGGGAAEEP
jgi:uncharacterized membrane protein (UPF0127 family)